MGIPAFVGAGSGITIETGTATVSKTGCTAGNVILCQMYVDGTVTTGLGRGSVVNIEKLDGTDSEMDVIETGLVVGSPQAGKGYYYIGRVIANGTCSMNFTVDSAGNDIFSRMYEFSGVTTATTVATVVENGASIYANAGDSASPLRDTAVTTMGANRLAINGIEISASQSVAEFTGMTGGTWAEVIEEYIGTGTASTLQLQSASMASAGTIDSGSQTISANPWGVIGFALIGTATETQSFYTSRRRTVGARR